MSRGYLVNEGVAAAAELRVEPDSRLQQFRDPVLTQSQIVGMMHHMAKSAQLIEILFDLSTKERGADSRNAERQPPEQSFMPTAVLLEMILKGPGDPDQHLFDRIVGTRQFERGGLPPPHRGKSGSLPATPPTTSASLDDPWFSFPQDLLPEFLTGLFQDHQIHGAIECLFQGNSHPGLLARLD